MRYPRIFTCSSARPSKSNCPSAPHRTTSPVPYLRSPGTPNGHATNRDPLNPARPQYPTPTPRPATYNSPTTPTGTRRNHASRTNTATVGGGAPIGATPDPTDPGAIGAVLAAYTVASVGP